MVKETELKYRGLKFTALTYKGSVIGHVLPKVCFFVIWTLTIVLVNRYVYSLIIFDIFMKLVILVLSLLLVFRTNTAYDRYWEGRRLWSNMTVAIRSMTRNIWILVPGSAEASDILAKKKAINLLAAFPFAVKRYLREEYGTHHTDISPLIDHIPRYSTPSSIQPLVQDLPGKNNHPNIPLESITLNSDFPVSIPTNLPIEITYCLSSYCSEITIKNKLSNPVIGALIANVNSLTDCLSGFERILRTPIPTAYSVHLNQLVWIFCLLLPFQLLANFPYQNNKDWLVIPVVALTVFTTFGIVNIGEEIENPFGYDANDLPLDAYCEIIKNELLSLTSLPPPKLDDWILKKI